MLGGDLGSSDSNPFAAPSIELVATEIVGSSPVAFVVASGKGLVAEVVVPLELTAPNSPIGTSFTFDKSNGLRVMVVVVVSVVPLGSSS